jgi:hypothetical protein
VTTRQFLRSLYTKLAKADLEIFQRGFEDFKVGDIIFSSVRIKKN